ncbi:hypothetical protein KR018_010372 [Drosophila ironensis]|nr:hypothetical protein KR018_010372 [Drosophila ironensis]
MALVWLLIVCFFFGRLKTQLLEIPDKKYSDLEEELLFRFLLRLKNEEIFDTLLVYGEECIFHSLSRRLDVSTVLVTSGSTSFDWSFSSLTLILSCGLQDDQEANNRTFMKLQRQRRVVYINEHALPEDVCNTYAQKEQYNIAVVNINHSLLVYACRFFQNPNHEEVNPLSDEPIFIDQFRNMRGAPIRTLADLLAPRSMIYQNSQTNETKLIGYVANVLNHFADKVNATLALQFYLSKSKKDVYYGNISKWANDDLLDIGMSVDSTWQKLNFDTLTYPYMTCAYCFMIPLPQTLPYSEIYTRIVTPAVLAVILLLFCIFSLLLIYSQHKSWSGFSLVYMLLNDRCMRGFLGQPFPFPLHSSRQLKLMCFLLCFASLMTTTMYEAYLQSFMTSPPPEALLVTFNDVDHSRYKVAISLPEMLQMQMDQDHKMKLLGEAHVQVFEDFNQFVRVRESFNASYIFPVTDVRWHTYREQQKLFTKPVFYYSDAFCLNRFFFLSIPLRRHLPYRHIFEEHILRQKEFGFLRYWINRSFYDMVKLGLTPLQDFSTEDPVDAPINLSDLSRIFSLYLGSMLFSCLCFVWERWGISMSILQRCKLRLNRMCNRG